MRFLCLRGPEACCKGSRVRLFYFFFITFSMCREMHAALLGATCKVGLSVCTVRAAPQLREILPAAKCSNFAWFFLRVPLAHRSKCECSRGARFKLHVRRRSPCSWSRDMCWRSWPWRSNDSLASAAMLLDPSILLTKTSQSRYGEFAL